MTTIQSTDEHCQETEKTRRTEYRILLDKLNDETFAHNFWLEKLREAEKMLSDILAVCSGSEEPAEGEWAAASLFRIFELMMIRHKNFTASEFAEVLQRHLFDWSSKRDDAYRKWATAQSQGFIEYGGDAEASDQANRGDEI